VGSKRARGLVSLELEELKDLKGKSQGFADERSQEKD